MNDRDLILGSIPAAAGDKDLPKSPRPEWVDGGGPAEFERRFIEAGGKIVEASDIKHLAPEKFWIEQGIDLETPSGCIRVQDIWECEFAVTRADLGIAETGSLVIANQRLRPRLASLTPEIHVAILRKDNVVASLDEALGRFKQSFVVITGPSRTADIEGVIVRGAHGPRELWLIWED